MTNFYGTLVSDTLRTPRTCLGNDFIEAVARSFGASFKIRLSGEPSSRILTLSSGQGSTILTDHEVLRVSLNDAKQFTSTISNDSAIGPVTLAGLINNINQLNMMLDNINKATEKVDYVVSQVQDSVGYGDLAEPLAEISNKLAEISARRDMVISSLKWMFKQTG